MYSSSNDISFNVSVVSSNCLVHSNMVCCSGNIIKRSIVKYSTYTIDYFSGLSNTGGGLYLNPTITNTNSTIVTYTPTQINKSSKLIVQAFFNVDILTQGIPPSDQTFGNDSFCIILYQKNGTTYTELDRGYICFYDEAGGDSRRQMRPLIGQINLTSVSSNINVALYSCNDNQLLHDLSPTPTDDKVAINSATFIFTQVPT